MALLKSDVHSGLVSMAVISAVIIRTALGGLGPQHLAELAAFFLSCATHFTTAGSGAAACRQLRDGASAYRPACR